VVEAYGGTLWRALRDGRLDAVLAPAGHASPDLDRAEVGSEDWSVLVGAGHSLAGIGPLAAGELHGERVLVTGHRDGAAFDRTVAELLTELGIDADLVPGAPGPALVASVAGNEALALTTAPDRLPQGVIARALAPHRTLSFELLWRDEPQSPALAEFIGSAAGSARREPSSRRLAAVA
jgi:hypothetical protein